MTDENIRARPFHRLADMLNTVRMSICAYGADETESCDCKFGIDPDTDLSRSEKTGCPELRKVVQCYRAYAKKL